MLEVERKRALGDETDPVVARLVEQGWEVEDVPFVEVDTYYSRPDVDFLETVECLRVRRRDGFSEITYKPASQAETSRACGIVAKRELNLALAGQGVEAEALLEAIGMVFLARVEKTRTTWRHSERANTTVVIDAVAGAGVFVEVEIFAQDEKHATAELTEVESNLGLLSAPVVTLPYRDIVRGALPTPQPGHGRR